MNKNLILYAIVILAFFGYGNVKAVVQEWDHEYVPFVEDGKVWYCSHGHWADSQRPSATQEDPTGEGIDCIFFMQGDTLIGDNYYKKVACQYEEYYGDKEYHYFCAVREDSYQVFIVEQETTDEKLLYDFSHPKETLSLEINNHKFPRLPGNHMGMCPTSQYEFTLASYDTEGKEDYTTGYGMWFEGTGLILGNPFSLEVFGAQPKFSKSIWVVSCIKEKAFIYHLSWMATPTEGTSLHERSIHETSLQTSYTFDLLGRRIGSTFLRPFGSKRAELERNVHRSTLKPGVYIRNGKKIVKK